MTKINTTTNKTIKLDFIGDVYANTINSKMLGTFYLKIFLKEDVKPEILQLALEDVVKKTPYIYGKVNAELDYELLSGIPQVILDEETIPFIDYYHAGDKSQLRVLYHKNAIKIEVSHVYNHSFPLRSKAQHHMKNG
ncbi:MAG: hypothetical protein LBV67_03415 [Streptococcaceae bacterium]|jgi:hypothetical protein|nr:hypothetical protein [Streptococcaceae bacterium]